MEPEIAVPSQLIGWLLLAAVPLLVAACTAFTKVSVVLAALRVGLGAESLLPYGVILSLSVVVTVVIMAPTGVASLTAALESGDMTELLGAGPEAWWPALGPLRDFMTRNASRGELEFFASLQGLPTDHALVVVPGFLVTELEEALHMAVLILLPFVIVDLIVAQVLTLVGMQQQTPTVVALPAKILLFLAAGGWDVILGGLVEGYL